MRTSNETRQILGIYEQLFAQSDKKRAADEQAEQAAIKRKSDADRNYEASVKQADTMQQDANSEARQLRTDIDSLERELATFATTTNFPFWATPPQAIATGAGMSVWNDILRHKRDAEAGCKELNANLDRIRKTRSRWWWILLFVR